MKNIITASLFAAACCAGSTASAQLKPFSFGPYVEAAFPSGAMSDAQNTGYGLGLSLDVKLPVKFNITGSAGFMHFGGKDFPGVANASYPAVNVLPVRVGAKYRFSGIFYGALETGAVFAVDNKTAKKTSGILAPAFGVRFVNLDFRAKYESWFNERSFWGLQAALRF
ncbi:hypothetical protein EPD60_03175 [Flaviaesturariibacter flavus]|uniref:Outer membrane protein beta-barrel domain-containing protein n=1 Tax=Flaviaesturariibacter flavus TaxID=2502780 RepID=A0A4R1BN47_9BACT|nr:hypothetical protein [Flaviaesturariibacter flavus]TCJ18776.1 hypothetical protein EPD60_03175 [Flaviaesturariibacter flavus]